MLGFTWFYVASVVLRLDRATFWWFRSCSYARPKLAEWCLAWNKQCPSRLFPSSVKIRFTAWIHVFCLNHYFILKKKKTKYYIVLKKDILWKMFVLEYSVLNSVISFFTIINSKDKYNKESLLNFAMDIVMKTNKLNDRYIRVAIRPGFPGCKCFMFQILQWL